ncbi:ankyrin repeat domain-containing protein [uncultured Campylobacter sp.]|uniref:ankyrin repeat domain-containing protein n=1 Tax=uncultured Campylobacter sp. TaxID=218934 RepID=UPI00263910FA|nr:ankyrin repeat domain-containing protein [uncultured Campylobacter sp.]
MNKLTLSLAALCLIVFVNFIYEKLSGPTRFVVTADTKIIPGSELSKYVTQEEIDDFAFRYWDIDKQIKDGAFVENFRKLLKSKQTNQILKFMQDNNISVDSPLIDGVTPLMYASFYDDEATAKRLIDMGANARAQDNYKLSPLAYAIENNSTKTAKLLLDSGVKFDEVKAVQYYIDPPFYNNIEKLIIDGDDVKIIFEDNYQVNKESKDANNPMRYIVWHNYVEMADIVLASGYKPKLDDHPNTFFHGLRDDSDFMRSLYISLDSHPDYEPMLELLLKYDVVGQPTKEELKKAYEECYKKRKGWIDYKENYIYKMNQGRDEEAEEKIQRTNNKYKYAPYWHIYQDGLLQYKPKPIDPKKIEEFDKEINFYNPHCPDQNATFKDIRAFIKWANEMEKRDGIKSAIGRAESGMAQVIYVDSNRSKSDSNSNLQSK